MADNGAEIGRYELSDFNTHPVTGDHHNKGVEQLYGLSSMLKEAGTPLPVEGPEISRRYLQDSGEGYYTHALGPGNDAGGNPTTAKVLHAVAIGRDTQTKEASIEGMFSCTDEPAALDAMYYVWLRRVINDLSFTRYLDYGETFYDETAGIMFNDKPDEHTSKLLATFGLERDGKWQVPLPRITLIGGPQTIDELLNDVPPPHDRTVALV